MEKCTDFSSLWTTDLSKIRKKSGWIGGGEHLHWGATGGKLSNQAMALQVRNTRRRLDSMAAKEELGPLAAGLNTWEGGRGNSSSTHGLSHEGTTNWGLWVKRLKFGCSGDMGRKHITALKHVRVNCILPLPPPISRYCWASEITTARFLYIGTWNGKEPQIQYLWVKMPAGGYQFERLKLLLLVIHYDP